jgi:hypothetical protein
MSEDGRPGFVDIKDALFMQKLDTLTLKHGALVLVIILMLMISGCSHEPTEEELAIVIYDEYRSLMASGKTLAALTALDRLQAYSNTDVYRQAFEEQLKKGISIGAALQSWTAQEMFKEKNRILAKDATIMKKARLPLPLEARDAWGTTMFVEFPDETQTFAFLIRSAGPDCIFKTTDDLILEQHQWSGQAGDPDSERTKIKKQAEKQYREILGTNPDTMDAVTNAETEPVVTKSGDAPEHAAQPTNVPGEKSLELDALLNSN